jgi:GIY-YIG catalytic domain
MTIPYQIFCIFIVGKVFMKFQNLFKLAKGGIYCIRGLKNQNIYIGESGSFLERAARHFTLLKAQYHECLLLQQEFDLYGSEFFEFNILIFEENKEKRIHLEKNMINEQLPEKCYNIRKDSRCQTNQPQFGQQISIDGKIYNTIRQAAKATDISKTTIIRRLNDIKDLKAIRLNKSPILRGKYNFIIDGICYLSTREVIYNHLASSDNQVREKCRSKSLKWKNWQMIQKKRSNDYPERE